MQWLLGEAAEWTAGHDEVSLLACAPAGTSPACRAWRAAIADRDRGRGRRSAQRECSCIRRAPRAA